MKQNLYKRTEKGASNEPQVRQDDGLIPRSLKLIFKVFNGLENFALRNIHVNQEIRLEYIALQG